jgi:hypothetical protein
LPDESLKRFRSGLNAEKGANEEDDEDEEDEEKDEDEKELELGLLLEKCLGGEIDLERLVLEE